MKTLFYGGIVALLLLIYPFGAHGQELKLSLQTGHAGPVQKVMFDPSGRWIISSGEDQILILWDIKTGKQVITFGGHQSRILDFTIHPTKPWIASIDEQGRLLRTEYPSGKILEDVAYKPNMINRVAYSPDGLELLLVGSQVWKKPLNPQLELQTQTFPTRPSFTELAVSPNKKYIAVGAYTEKQILLLDYQSLAVLEIFKCENPTDLHFSETDEVLLASGAKYLHKITFGEQQSLLRGWRFNAENRWHTFQAVKGTAQYMIGAAKNDLIHILDLQTGKKKRTLKAHLDQINTLAINSDESLLASAGYDGYILLWDIETGDLIRPLYGFVDQINYLSFDASGEHLLIGYRDGAIRDWHLPSNQIQTQKSPFEKKRASERVYRWTYSIDSLAQIDGTDSIQVVAKMNREVKEVLNQRVVPMHWVTTWFKKKDVSTRTIPYYGIWDQSSGDYTVEKDKELEKGYALPSSQPILKANRGLYQVQISSAQILTIRRGPEQLVERTTGHLGRITSLVIHPTEPLIVTGSWDGTIKFWNLKDGQELVTSIALGERDFLYLRPDNFYFLSKSVADGVAFNYGDQVLSFAQFDHYYNRPHLALAALPFWDKSTLRSYERSFEKRLERMSLTPENLQIDLSALPKLDILNEADIPLQTQEEQIEVQVKASDQKTALKSINVFINGVPISHSWQSIKPTTQSLEVTIPLILTLGDNTIQLSVTNQQEGQSLERAITVNYQPPNPSKPDLYVVAIGASKYEQSSNDLQFAAKDAQDLLALMEARKKEFRNVHTTLLLNEQVSTTNIADIKAKLLQSQPQDEVVVFYAGHGLLDEAYDYYLATYWMDFTNPKDGGLPYEDLENLLSGIPARKKLLLMDACHSGEIDKASLTLQQEESTSVDFSFRDPTNQVGLQESFDLMKELFADVRRGTGATVLSSARGGAAAQEGAQWGNGVFTYAFKQGLAEKQADFNGDKQIQLSEMQRYLSEEVPRLTDGRQQPTYRTANLLLDYPIWQ